ncbi:MAG: SDR family oxidoreductase [Saprospiraceae bacterium]|nr:SDR family oxidoreductase [Saprospiraceae bacterium]
MSDIKNKKVWITGASSGIGEALAYAFANQGAELILSSRKRSDLERVQSKCQGAKAVHLEPLDVARHADVLETAKRVQEKIGPIDILINNAGISQRSLVEETPLDIDKRIMDVNYFGAIALTKAVLPAMLQQQSGQIIVMSSLVGKFGTPLRSTYSASKHALHGFFEALRAECYDRGLKVLIVCPGFIRTSVSINAITADGSKQNKMDDAQEHGMAPEVLAEKIIQALLAGKEEVNIGGKEVLGILLKRFFPRWFSRYIRKAKVT